MYPVDQRDRVEPLEDLPRASVGSPCPLAIRDEMTAVLAYYRDDRGPERERDSESGRGPATLVRFSGVRATMFGPPNDEAFDGHPLAGRGLRRYAAAEVLESSWVRGLERMNRVHPRHRAEHFAHLRHFVLTFHDSTFECVAKGYDFRFERGPLGRLLPDMLALLGIDRDAEGS